MIHRTRLKALLVLTSLALQPAFAGVAPDAALDPAGHLQALIDDAQLPSFRGWTERQQLFISLPATRTAFGGSVPLITMTHFNEAARSHILQNALNTAGRLGEMNAGAIPAFPDGAQITLSAWWPVAAHMATPVPVWDANASARANASNGYLSWPQVVALRPDATAKTPDRIVFAGRYVDAPQTFGSGSIASRPIDDALARQLMSVDAASKLARMVLGRELVAGDRLALVALHLMRVDQTTRSWNTYWWQPAQRSGDSDQTLPAPWNNYMMDSTVDAIEPREEDGSPNICFNPWLDGGLLDHGAGNGMRSNCVSCHLRAAYPAVDALRVTRGITTPPDGSLATDMVWTLSTVRQGLRPTEPR